MKLIRTGRILDWFVRDLRMLAGRPDVKLVHKPYQASPYRPPGVWAETTPGPGMPLLWRFPQPLHPLEAIAAVRGMGGLEPDGFDTTIPEHLQRVREAAAMRFLSWVDFTTLIACHLFVTPETVRLVYQMLAPLNGPQVSLPGATVPTYNWAQDQVLGACGYEYTPSLFDGWSEGPSRIAFHTTEVTGDIEL